MRQLFKPKKTSRDSFFVLTLCATSWHPCYTQSLSQCITIANNHCVQSWQHYIHTISTYKESHVANGQWHLYKTELGVITSIQRRSVYIVYPHIYFLRANRQDILQDIYKGVHILLCGIRWCTWASWLEVWYTCRNSPVVFSALLIFSRAISISSQLWFKSDLIK